MWRSCYRYALCILCFFSISGWDEVKMWVGVIINFWLSMAKSTCIPVGFHDSGQVCVCVCAEWRLAPQWIRACTTSLSQISVCLIDVASGFRWHQTGGGSRAAWVRQSSNHHQPQKLGEQIWILTSHTSFNLMKKVTHAVEQSIDTHALVLISNCRLHKPKIHSLDDI